MHQPVQPQPRIRGDEIVNNPPANMGTCHQVMRAALYTLRICGALLARL